MAAMEMTREQLVEEWVLRHTLEMVVDWQAGWCGQILAHAVGEETAAGYQDITAEIDSLWPRLWDSEDDVETPEYLRASGRACATASAIFAWLATDAGQTHLREQAVYHAGLATSHLRKAEAA